MIYQQFLLRCDVGGCGAETTLAPLWSYTAGDTLWLPYIPSAFAPTSGGVPERRGPELPLKGWRQLDGRVYCPKHDIQLTITTHVPDVHLMIDHTLSEGQSA